MFRAAAFVLALAAIATPAPAETIVIRPDPCPAAAGQPLIIDLGEVELFNAAPGAALGNVLVIYPPPGDGWASARLLMRFDLDHPSESPGAAVCERSGPFPRLR